MKNKPETAEDDSEGLSHYERQLRRNEETRKKLLDAAAKVVGEYGYAGASISRITAEAGVAHGAFYLHFPSRQALFDILLPAIGHDMIEQIGQATRNARSLADVEVKGVSANFRYLAEHNSLFRVMTEAEFFAPDTYREFIEVLLERYIKSLQRSLQRGEVKGFGQQDLEMLATILMGARDFLLLRFVKSEEGGGDAPREAIRVYLRFVLAGLAYADRIDLDDLLDAPARS